MKFMVKTQNGTLIPCNGFYRQANANQIRDTASEWVWGVLAEYETEERTTDVYRLLEEWIRHSIVKKYNCPSTTADAVLKLCIEEFELEQAIFTFPKE